jgi:hypothetical protein
MITTMPNMTHLEIFKATLATVKEAGFMDNLKQQAGSAFDTSKNFISSQAEKLKDFQPFNPNNSMSSMGYGALGGAALGAGAAGIGRLFGGGGQNSSMLGTLLKGGLIGVGIGGGMGYAASALGPQLGGYLGARKLHNASGVADVPDNHFGGSANKTSLTDAIKKLGYGAGSGLIQELRLRDIARAIENGKLDYNDLGQRMMKRRLDESITGIK